MGLSFLEQIAGIRELTLSRFVPWQGFFLDAGQYHRSPPVLKWG
jgi:hypothetical protein